MAFNGNGIFVRLYNWVNDAAAGIKIRADRMDNEMNGFATGLSTCITKDGQTTVTANLPMASFRHISVGNAVDRTDYASAGQLQDGNVNWAVAGGTVDAITAGYAIVISAVADGQLFFVRASGANTVINPTFAPGGFAARTIVKQGGIALLVGDINGAGHQLILRYDLANTRYELLNPCTAKSALTAASSTTSTTSQYTSIPIQTAVGAGTVDAITADYTPNITLADTVVVIFISSGPNTVTNPTFSPDGLTARTITKNGGSVLSVGDTGPAGNRCILQYNSSTTVWELLNPAIPVTTTGTQTLTNKTIDASLNTVTNTVHMLTSQIASGTEVLFTGIPSTAKKITISFYNVSLNATSGYLVRLGDSGGIETTGYASTSSLLVATVVTAASTVGCLISRSANAAVVHHGSMNINLVDAANNQWALSGTFSQGGGVDATINSAGIKALSASLDRVSITTVNGTDTFDSGIIVVSYQL